jgi:hypothetical protein
MRERVQGQKGQYQFFLEHYKNIDQPEHQQSCLVSQSFSPLILTIQHFMNDQKKDKENEWI